MQILADAFGTVLHLFERDCSVQRRHQKVIEEAPAVAISDAVRWVVTSAAVRLAEQVGYLNAGTVEFLVSGENAYLLEVNTRLQVEHPVTELVTGRDIVALQLLIAQGFPLPFTQQDVAVSGHAIEVRIYAEDPDNGFLPQAGVADTVRWPESVRIDAALDEGQQVTAWYDPMLGKLIVHGATREAARRRLVDALDRTAIIGVPTNVGFLRGLAASVAFVQSDIDTAWLDRTEQPVPAGPVDLELCAAAWAIADERRSTGAGPFGTGDGWRTGSGPAPTRVLLEHDGREHELLVDRVTGTVVMADRSWSVKVGGLPQQAAADGGVFLEINGERLWFFLRIAVDAVDLAHGGRWVRFVRGAARHVQHAAPTDGRIMAPMPGMLTLIRVGRGDRVSVGQVLGVMEAMKMEHALVADVDGIVVRVAAVPGAQVAMGDALFTVEPDIDLERDAAAAPLARSSA